MATADKPRYRTRKGQIATNTLAVCDRYMRFIFFLPGWEGSAGDARILRDAVSRQNGLRVPIGNSIPPIPIFQLQPNTTNDAFADLLVW